MNFAKKAIAGATAILASICCVASASAAPADCLTPRSHSLRLYQSLMYSNRPDLAELGFAPAHIVDRDIYVDETTKDRISPAKVRERVSQLSREGGLVVLDIEHFPLTGADDRVRGSVSQLVGAAAAAREVSGDVPVGYYGMVPLLSEYWRPINGLEHGGAAEWRADNRRLAPIAAAVDVNMPSLYAYYDDRDGWVRQAKALVCEARRYSDKPVIAFIWPEFHPSSKPSGTAIPGDYWRLQLETLADIADGVVIWGGYDLARERAEPWDANAPWWHETLDFLARHRRNPLLRPVG